MKHLLLSLLTLTLLGACGKENKSGKSEWNYPHPSLDSLTQGNVPGNIASLLTTVPCSDGSRSRQQMQLPMTGFSTVIPVSETYVGITSFGDVGVIYGQGSSAPTFIAYLCSRNFTNYQGSTLSNVRLGSYSNCSFKPIPSATLTFPSAMGGAATADFRMLDYGYNNGSALVKIPGICK